MGYIISIFIIFFIYKIYKKISNIKRYYKISKKLFFQLEKIIDKYKKYDDTEKQINLRGFVYWLAMTEIMEKVFYSGDFNLDRYALYLRGLLSNLTDSDNIFKKEFTEEEKNNIWFELEKRAKIINEFLKTKDGEIILEGYGRLYDIPEKALYNIVVDILKIDFQKNIKELGLVLSKDLTNLDMASGKVPHTISINFIIDDLKKIFNIK